MNWCSLLERVPHFHQTPQPLHLFAPNASSPIVSPAMHIHSVCGEAIPISHALNVVLMGDSWLGRTATCYLRTHKRDHILLHVPLDPTGEAPVESVAPHITVTLITATKTQMTYEVVRRKKISVILLERRAVQHNQFRESTNTCYFIITNNKWTLGSW